MESRADELTEIERETLILVSRSMTSKEIAQVLGISPHTVDQRIKKAMRTLGVTSRREAARRVCNQWLVHQPPVVESPVSPPLTGSPSDRNGPIAVGGSGHADDLSDAPARWHETATRLILLRLFGRPAQKRTAGAKLLIMMLVSIFSALAFGALMSGLQAIGNLF